MTPTKPVQKPKPAPKPSTQKHPVNNIPKGREWGSVKTNAEKAAYKDWNGG